MNPLTILFFSDYPAARPLALALKTGDKAAVTEAARRLAPLLGDKAVTIVPVPSHSGRPTGTLRVAAAIAALRKGRRTVVLPCLRCEPRASRHDLKHAGTPYDALPHPSMFLRSWKDADRLCLLAKTTTVVVLDDVIDTGETIREAALLSHATHALALAVTDRYEAPSEDATETAAADCSETINRFLEDLYFRLPFGNAIRELFETA